MTVNRAPAQYCPYCGETNLWPHEASHGAWTCRDCARVFTVKFLGLAGSLILAEPADAIPAGPGHVGTDPADTDAQTRPAADKEST